MTVPIRETTAEIPPYLLLNRAAKGVDRTVWRIPDDLVPQARFVIDGDGVHEQAEAILAGPFTEAPE